MSGRTRQVSEGSLHFTHYTKIFLIIREYPSMVYAKRIYQKI